MYAHESSIIIFNSFEVFQSFNVLIGGRLLQLQVPGLVNVDFADVRAIMENAGSSLMGIGTATGKVN